MTYITKNIYIYFFCLLLGSGSLLGNDGDVAMTIDKTRSSVVSFDYVGGLIVVNAVMNGVQGDYIVDTGAPNLIINKKVAQADFEIWTMDVNLKAANMTVTSFKYGNLSEEEVPAWAMDLTHIEELLNRPISGIIGHDIIKKSTLDINYEANEIAFLPLNSGGLDFDPNDYIISSVPLQLSTNNLPLITLVIDGVEHSFVFDTGAGISVVNDDVSVDKTISISDQLKINNITVKDVPYISQNLSELSEVNHQNIAGILSISSLKTAKVIVDYKSSRVHLFWKKEDSI